MLVLQSLAEQHVAKLQRFLQEDSKVVVHVKGYSPLGDRVKYSLHVRVTGSISLGAESVEWNIRDAAHSVFEKLQKELEKKAGRNKAIPPKRR